VTLDIGDEKDVHPRNKRDVGNRLARIALSKTYGKKIEGSGPIFHDGSIEGGKIRIRFDHVGGGLVTKGGGLKRFAIAGEDRKFVWADAVIEGDQVVVSNKEVTRPAFIRYAWSENPMGANLFNAEGLPAAPFRTDP